jgi:hypothetical protein
MQGRHQSDCKLGVRSLPVTAVYLTGRGVHAATWRAFALTPVRDWQTAWHQALAGQAWTAFALTAPVAVPAGLLAASWLWAWRIPTVETGLSGKTATAPVVFDARQWHRASRAARGRVTAPGTFPLATRSGQVVMGAVIRAVGHRWRPACAMPYQAMGRHQVVIGSSGCGKTKPDDADLGRLVHRRPRRPSPAAGGAAAADRHGPQRRPRRPG